MAITKVFSLKDLSEEDINGTAEVFHELLSSGFFPYMKRAITDFELALKDFNDEKNPVGFHHVTGNFLIHTLEQMEETLDEEILLRLKLLKISSSENISGFIFEILNGFQILFLHAHDMEFVGSEGFKALNLVKMDPQTKMMAIIIVGSKAFPEATIYRHSQVLLHELSHILLFLFDKKYNKKFTEQFINFSSLEFIADVIPVLTLSLSCCSVKNILETFQKYVGKHYTNEEVVIGYQNLIEAICKREEK